MLFLCVSNQRGLFYRHFMVYFWDTLCWDVMNSITYYSNCCLPWPKSQKQVTRRRKTEWHFLNISGTKFMQNWRCWGQLKNYPRNWWMPHEQRVKGPACQMSALSSQELVCITCGFELRDAAFGSAFEGNCLQCILWLFTNVVWRKQWNT